MDEVEARKILGDAICDDGGLRRGGSGYVWWPQYDGTVCLDDHYTADDLEAIAWWMRNAK